MQDPEERSRIAVPGELAEATGSRPAATILDRTATRVTVVVAVVALLSVSAVLLTRDYHAQQALRASRTLAEGRALLVADRHADAVARFRASVALDPTRIAARLELANALLTLGRPHEARSHLQDVLRDDPVNGPANLSMARVEKTLGRPDEAETSYYRAIYGLWGPADQRTRVEVRLELIALLRQIASPERVRSELTQLANAFPGDLPLQLRVGRNLLELGFADDAAMLYRQVAQRFADPGGAFAGLAEAELARRRYFDAFEAARRAVTLDPSDRVSLERRDLAAAVLALDPNQPRLSVRERTARVRNLLTLARARLVSCRPPETTSPPDDLLPVVDRWLGAARRLQIADVDIGMALLSAASQRIVAQCSGVEGPRAVELVLNDLARESRS
jgi:tetratricopeptide (TPR) repeat protein